jgi:hypothetical protein
MVDERERGRAEQASADALHRTRANEQRQVRRGAALIDPAIKTRKPMLNTRRAPNRSLSAPAVRISAANINV